MAFQCYYGNQTHGNRRALELTLSNTNKGKYPVNQIRRHSQMARALYKENIELWSYLRGRNIKFNPTRDILFLIFDHPGLYVIVMMLSITKRKLFSCIHKF